MYSNSTVLRLAAWVGFAAAVGGIGCGERPANAGEPLPVSAELREAVSKRYPENVDDLRAIQQQVRRVVEQVRPTVVAVQIGGAIGSGVLVSEDGLVLTAGHVAIKPNLPVTFFFPDGSRARGRSLGLDRSIDSGMLRITDPGPWPFTPIGRAGALERGDWVVTLGQPNGFFADRAPPVRLGRVLSVDDEVIHTDCTLVGGDSGGPLVNLKGEVVGIHSRIAKAITSNFHVPIAAYRSDWDRLLAGQDWGSELTSEEEPRYQTWIGLLAERNKSPCRVTQVLPNMPAAQAGVKVGDIILRYEGEKIDTVEDLALMVLKSKPEQKVTLEISRDGKRMPIEVWLGRIAKGFPGSAAPKS
ncbi:MAG: trypsin-like peptidase domain-containing protein [Planctomycetota bacterium]